MSYSDFTLAKVKKEFELIIVEIDLSECYLKDVNKIMGILASAIGES